jgi:multiple sugar transport system permease protein
VDKKSSKTISPVAVFVTLYLVVIVFPFLWVLAASFKPTSEIFGDGAFRIISANPTIENYVNVLQNGILQAMWNSFVVASIPQSM